MGSYSVLKFGHFSMGEFKSHVPLEPLLLFEASDYRKTPLTAEDMKDDDPDEERPEEYKYTYKLVTTAAKARERANARGLSLETCEALYNEFRGDSFYVYKPNGEDRTVKNNVTYQKYLAACKQVFKNHDTWYLEYENSTLNEKVTRIFRDGFFNEDVEFYFQDASYFIILRSFLEIVPDDEAIELDWTDLVYEGSELVELENIYDHFMQRLFRKFGIQYQLYGFLFENDPNVETRLRQRIDGMNEDQFIQHVLLPLFEKMGFQRLQKVIFHGPNEFGSDVRAFRYTTPLGTLEYYAAQAKAVPIHGTSAREGNAGELISQATQAFAVAFVDDIDNERKHIDKFIVATSKSINSGARIAIESAVEGRRNLVFWDVDAVVPLLKKHGLVQYVLFSTI